MKLTRLDNIYNPSFPKAWDLYQKAFPAQERRLLTLQEKIIKNRHYHFEIISQENVFLGFILWWQLENFKYIEHFAILPSYRGSGYGQSIINKFIAENKDLIILEVEQPQNNLKQRRIAFYERIGFKINPHYYQQLPLQTGHQKLELKLMSFPRIISELELESFNEYFKRICYQPYFE